MAKMTTETRLKQHTNVPWKEIENEGVLLRLTDGDYYSVNETGLRIWKLLNGTKTLGQVARNVSSYYNISQELALSHLLEFVTLLEKKKLACICGQKGK